MRKNSKKDLKHLRPLFPAARLLHLSPLALMGKGGKGKKAKGTKYVTFDSRSAAPTNSSGGSPQPPVSANEQSPRQGTSASTDSGRAGDAAARSGFNASSPQRDSQHDHAASIGSRSPSGGQGTSSSSSAAADGTSNLTSSRPGSTPVSPSTSSGPSPAPHPTRAAPVSSSSNQGGTPATARTNPATPSRAGGTPGGAQAQLGTSKSFTPLITQPHSIPDGLTSALSGHVVRHNGRATDGGFIVLVYSPALRRHFVHRGKLSWSPRSGCGVNFKPTGDTLKFQGVKLLVIERLTPRRKLDSAPSSWVATTLQRNGRGLRFEMAFPPLVEDSKPLLTHLELDVTQGGQPPFPSGTPLRIQVGVAPGGGHCLLGAQLDLAALRHKVPTQLHPDELTQFGPDTLVLGGLGDRDARLGSRHLPLGDILTHPTRTLEEWDMTKALCALASANKLPRTPALSSSQGAPSTAQPAAAGATLPRPIVVVVVAEGGKNFLRDWHRRINLWFDGSCREGLTRASLAIRQRFQFHLIAPVEARVTPPTVQALLPLEFMHDTSNTWNYAQRLRLQDQLVATFKVATDSLTAAHSRSAAPAPLKYVQTGQDMRLAVLDYTWEKLEPADCNVSIPTALHRSCAFSAALVPGDPSGLARMEEGPEDAEEVIDIALPPTQGVIVEFAQQETTTAILEGILKHAAAGSAAGVQVSNFHSFRGADHGAIIQGPAGYDHAGLARYLNGRAAQPTFNAMPLSHFFSKSAIDLWLDDRAAVSTALLRRLFGPKATFYQNGPHAVRVFLPADHRMRARETLVEGLSNFNKNVGEAATLCAAPKQGASGLRSRQRPALPFFKSFTLGGLTTWLLRERPRPRRQWGSPEAAQRAADPTVRLLFGVDASVPSDKVLEVLQALGVPKATATSAYRVQTRLGSHMVALRLGAGDSLPARTVRLGGTKAWLGPSPPTLELADRGPLLTSTSPPSIGVMVGVLDERLGLQTPLTTSRGSYSSRPKTASNLLAAAGAAHQLMVEQASAAKKVVGQVRVLTGLAQSSPTTASTRSARRTTPSTPQQSTHNAPFPPGGTVPPGPKMISFPGQSDAVLRGLPETVHHAVVARRSVRADLDPRRLRFVPTAVAGKQKAKRGTLYRVQWSLVDADDSTFYAGLIDDTAISGTEGKALGEEFAALVKTYEDSTSATTGGGPPTDQHLQPIPEETTPADDDEEMAGDAEIAAASGSATTPLATGSTSSCVVSPWTIAKASNPGAKRRRLAAAEGGQTSTAQGEEAATTRATTGDDQDPDRSPLPFPQQDLNVMTIGTPHDHSNHTNDDRSTASDSPHPARPTPPGSSTFHSPSPSSSK
jgi:hypothetical protein